MKDLKILIVLAMIVLSNYSICYSQNNVNDSIKELVDTVKVDSVLSLTGNLHSDSVLISLNAIRLANKRLIIGNYNAKLITNYKSIIQMTDEKYNLLVTINDKINNNIKIINDNLAATIKENEKLKFQRNVLAATTVGSVVVSIIAILL